MQTAVLRAEQDAPASRSWRLPPAPVWIALVAAAAVAAPILSVLWNLFQGGTAATWQHLAATVLAEYLLNTLYLCLGVGIGVLLLGVGTAWVVSMQEFPGRRLFEWALILPLAMPAYVMAYVYTDLLQFVGPVQGALRETFGWRRADYWFPEVRSLPGAVAMFTLVLYPYVYLVVRVAFLERSAQLFEAARALGHGPWASFLRVALPLARPAIAVGVGLALMETLADYGTVSYFAVPTFTTGIYRAWFSLGDRVAAAQLAACLLGFVLLVLALERATRGRARHGGGQRARAHRRQHKGLLAQTAAFVLCLLPVLGGFLLPAALLLRMSVAEGDQQFGARYFKLVGDSLLLAGLSALLAVACAVGLAYAVRISRSRLTAAFARIASSGYAVPGSVIAVGVLIPLTRVDNALANWLTPLLGQSPGLLLTGSIAALVYACLVRFLTAALQTVEAGLARVTPAMDDAARSLGCDRWAVLRRVHLPIISGSALTAGLLVFVDVMKELPATLVMRPFNFDTLATQVHVLAADERLGEASTAALSIVVVGLLPLILLSRRIARRV